MSWTETPPWPDDPAVFLDLDGTLTKIAETPDAVSPSPELHRLLERLPMATAGAVAIISGRTVEDVDRVLAPHQLPVAGIHGLERRNIEGRVIRLTTRREWIDRVGKEMLRFAERYPGVIVEDKRVSVALHYRRRPELEEPIDKLIVALELPPDVECLRGRKVIEIKPAYVNKGLAIRAYMSEAPFAGRTPLFAGDDFPDEAGFRAVEEFGGVSIKVGPGSSTARWALPSVDHLLTWLRKAIDASDSRVLAEPK